MPLPPFSRDRCPHCGATLDACRCGLREPWPFSNMLLTMVTLLLLAMVMFAYVVALLWLKRG